MSLAHASKAHAWTTVVALALAALAACDRAPSAPQPPAAPALAPVVSTRLAAAERRVIEDGRVTPTPPANEPTADERDAARSALSALASSDPRLAGYAREDLRALGAAALPELTAALVDETAAHALRQAALNAILELDAPAAVDALCSGLELAHGAPDLRAACAAALVERARDAHVPRLVLRLRYETDGAAVVSLADALARRGELSGIDGLAVLSEGGQGPEIAALAAAKLAELARAHDFADGAALRTARQRGELPLPDPSPELELEAWRWIAKLSEWNLRTVDDARFVLVRLEGWVVPLLAATLSDEGVYARVHAAQCLERRGARAREAVTALIAALGEPRVAPGAASALGSIGDARARQPLERALAGGADLDLATAAARALGALGDPAARTALRRAFDTQTEPRDLRQAAAGALLALGDAQGTLAYLASCLTDPRADPVWAETDIEAWLVAGAATDPARASALERWRALAAHPIPTVEQTRARLAARAELVRGLKP